MLEILTAIIDKLTSLNPNRTLFQSKFDEKKIFWKMKVKLYHKLYLATGLKTPTKCKKWDPTNIAANY